ncbi:hypothetical protein V462_10750 [Pantoea ananatis 15320]|nr:hypothetical protein V462_10750 [Pantoea ananatis 15320]
MALTVKWLLNQLKRRKRRMQKTDKTERQRINVLSS